MSRSVRIVVRILGVLVLITLIVWLVLYAFFRPVQSSEPDAQLPNPAAVYCEEQGGTIEMRTTADGGQHGVCLLPDGSECDEWALYRDECGPAGATAQGAELIIAPSPVVLQPGQPVKVTGAGYEPGATIALRLGVRDAGLSDENLVTVTVDARGMFQVEMVLPTEWPGTQNRIVERELVIAAVDETRGQTVGIAPFAAKVEWTVECFDDCMIFARDIALVYVAQRYGQAVPAPDAGWTLVAREESIAAGGSPARIVHYFAAGKWATTVSYKVGALRPVVYVIEIGDADSGFAWTGTVNTSGQVSE